MKEGTSQALCEVSIWLGSPNDLRECFTMYRADPSIRWHPLTKALLTHYGFTQDWDKEPNGDMMRGNWRISPERNHHDDADLLGQYPLTLEHTVRGVCLKIYEPPMLDLLRILG